MRTWNYRVIERVTQLKTPAGAMDVYRAIHDVHYESDGRPIAYSAQPTTIGWDPAEGDEVPLAILDRMREALTKPVLTEQDFPSSDAGLEALGGLPSQGIKPFPVEGDDVRALKGMFGASGKVVSVEQMNNSGGDLKRK